MWSRKHEKCIGCVTTETSHVALGRCLNCYRKLLNERHTGYKGRAEKRKNTKLTGKKPGHLLTKEYLDAEYNLKKRSLGEIAKECGCTRTFVYRRLKSYGIPQRDKTTARTLALTKGKLIFERTDEDGQSRSVTLQKNIYNEDFFSEWSDKMAYVLGVICTDGHIRPSKYKDPFKKSKVSISRVAVTQKEPELLEKTLSLMDCNAKLIY
jgi:hypothetical protein